MVSTQVLVREADASIQPRVERYARNPGTGGRSVIQPTSWAAALAAGAVERTTAAATRWRADPNGLPPTTWAGGFLLDGTQGSALARSTLGCMLSPASQAEEADTLGYCSVAAAGTKVVEHQLSLRAPTAVHPVDKGGLM